MKNMIILLVILFAPFAQAFTSSVCFNESKTVKAKFFSDAPFGKIFVASLEYDNKVFNYENQKPPYIRFGSGPAIITFSNGAVLIVTRGHMEAVAFDENGNLLTKLNCNLE